MSDHEIRTNAIVQSLERQRNDLVAFFATREVHKDATIALLQGQLMEANRKVAKLEAEIAKLKPAESKSNGAARQVEPQAESHAG